PFSEQRAAVRTGPRDAGGNWGFIDPAGDWVLRPHFDRVGSFGGNCAPAQPGPRDEEFADRRGLWGYIDPDGQWIVAPQFVEAHPFSDDLALVGRAQGNGVVYCYIRPDGATAFTVDTGMPRPFRGGLAAVVDPEAPDRITAYF